jgi:ABC-type protease/lipase transport system fused ATPase/permease subunit
MKLSAKQIEQNSTITTAINIIPNVALRLSGTAKKNAARLESKKTTNILTAAVIATGVNKLFQSLPKGRITTTPAAVKTAAASAHLRNLTKGWPMGETGRQSSASSCMRVSVFIVLTQKAF